MLISVGMVVTGSLNTITTKLADNTKAVGINGGKSRQFNHPFLQAWFMFVGELLCLLVFRLMVLRASRKSKKDRDAIDCAEPFSPLIFVLPACCDMTATSLMYLGLTMTDASVFQMLRGSVIIFTGIFSIIWLKRKLYLFHWIGMSAVLIGCVIVGLASVLNKPTNSSEARNPELGNTLIVVAQVVTAVQMVVEERYVSGKNIPALQAVGWEGFFGVTILGLLLIPMYYIPAVDGLSETESGGSHFEDALDGFNQISNSVQLLLCICGTITSIACFNYFGISVTKSMSAVHRMVLDSIRTIVIWGVSLFLGWEQFQWMQMSGFCVLLFGTMVYNEILSLESLGVYYPDKEMQESLLPSKSAKKNRSASFSMLKNNVNPESKDGSHDGNKNSEIVADDWFSPKLSHYQTKA